MVKISCRCVDCVVGEEVINDGQRQIFCHTKLIYTQHEDFCSQGRKRVVSEDGTKEPEAYHRCKRCTAILNFMSDHAMYCADCGEKVDWSDIE